MDTTSFDNGPEHGEMVILSNMPNGRFLSGKKSTGALCSPMKTRFGLIGFSEFHSDISRRQEAREALQRSKKKDRILFEQANPHLAGEQ